MPPIQLNSDPKANDSISLNFPDLDLRPQTASSLSPSYNIAWLGLGTQKGIDLEPPNLSQPFPFRTSYSQQERTKIKFVLTEKANGQHSISRSHTIITMKLDRFNSPSRSNCMLHKANTKGCISRKDIGYVIRTVASKNNFFIRKRKRMINCFEVQQYAWD